MANGSASLSATDSVTMTRSSQALRTSTLHESTQSYQGGKPNCCINCWDSRAMTIIKALLKATIKSVVWRTMVISLSVYLLFGSQLRHLFIPSSWDAAFDIISLVVFGFFIVDMIIRMIMFRNYFSVRCCNKNSGNALNDGQTGFEFGSFVFWCDLVSSITLLYDVSWINRGEYSVKEVEIQLDAFGSPVSSCTHKMWMYFGSCFLHCPASNLDIQSWHTQ